MCCEPVLQYVSGRLAVSSEQDDAFAAFLQCFDCIPVFLMNCFQNVEWRLVVVFCSELIHPGTCNALRGYVDSIATVHQMKAW